MVVCIHDKVATGPECLPAFTWGQQIEAPADPFTPPAHSLAGFTAGRRPPTGRLVVTAPGFFPPSASPLAAH